MATRIERPSIIEAAGNKPKIIEENGDARYVAACLPAFSPDTLDRDEA